MISIGHEKQVSVYRSILYIDILKETYYAHFQVHNFNLGHPNT